MGKMQEIWNPLSYRTKCRTSTSKKCDPRYNSTRWLSRTGSIRYPTWGLQDTTDGHQPERAGASEASLGTPEGGNFFEHPTALPHRATGPSLTARSSPIAIPSGFPPPLRIRQVEITPEIIVDEDADRRIIGIEILYPHRNGSIV